MPTLPQHALSNIEIDDIMKKKFPAIKYIGTFPINNIPVLQEINTCMIVNNKPISHGGEHWMGIYKGLKDVYIYDSFGRDKDEYINGGHLTNQIKRWRDTDDKPEQFIWQQNCGARTISWISTCHKFTPEITSKYI